MQRTGIKKNRFITRSLILKANIRNSFKFNNYTAGITEILPLLKSTVIL